MTGAQIDSMRHVSVMLEETLSALAPRDGGVYADATLGRGGHTAAILDRSAPSGRVIAVDQDEAALAETGARLAPYGDRVTTVHARFSQLRDVLDQHNLAGVDGLIADVGVSSPQLDDADRGFSFARSGPIDMRMDRSRGETALELIARLSDDELANVIYELGEDRKSRRIARSIKRMHGEGELETTADLRRAVVRAVGPKRGRIDPATRTFQALRIAVNRELDELRALMAALPSLLVDGGVAVIISFHSLEDRIVKRATRDMPTLAPLTKRPLVASDDERDRNPRSRPAKLRAARRVPRAEVAS